MVTPQRHQKCAKIEMTTIKFNLDAGVTEMKCNVISIDLAKNIFQICALGDNHKVLMNKKVKRSNLLNELRQFEPTLVVMEACYSANPWGRRIEKLGHEVKCIPAFAVKPFVIGNKNDANDALAIAEASFRPTIRFVSVKPVEQQDIQSLQRFRELLKKQRAQQVNQLRGLLAEYGEVCPKTYKGLMSNVLDILENAENELTDVTRRLFEAMKERLLTLSLEIENTEKELATLVSHREDYKLLIAIPGIGPIVAATIIASVNDIHSFKNGRQFAAWIGLTPKQHSSGETNRLGKISKRGNQSLRKMLIHGARAVLNWTDKKSDNLSLWLNKIKKKMHNCKSVVALANKLARIVWAVLTQETEFDAKKACA